MSAATLSPVEAAAVLGATLEPQTTGTNCYTCDSKLRADGVCVYCVEHLAALHIKQGTQLLFEPKQLVEVRALLKDGGVLSGYFNSRAALGQALHDLELAGKCKSIYTSLNPVDPAAIDAAAVTNSVGVASRTTRDRDVLCRRWLLLDFDPVRPSDTSSNAAELRAANRKQSEVHLYLTSLGWPEPLSGVSGNGSHLLYRLPELPNDETSTELVNGVLRYLSGKFSDDKVDLDRSVGNASRIVKAYGTTARKGSETAERPWRGSELRVPCHTVQPVTLTQLQALVALLPPTAPRRKPAMAPDFDMDQFVNYYDLDVMGTDLKDGVEYHYLDTCPLAGRRHSGDPKKTALVLGDVLGFSCFSDDCAGRGIGDFLREMSQTYQPYPYPLFAEVEVGGEGEDAEWEPSPTQDAVAATIGPAAEEEQLQVPTVHTTAVQHNEEDRRLLQEDGLAPIDPPTYQEQEDQSAIPLPAEALYGWLGEKAKTLQSPMGWAYPAMLTLFAALGINMEPNPRLPESARPTLFTVLLGNVSDGKSRTMSRAELTLLSLHDDFKRHSCPSSDTGILKMFSPPAPKKGDPPVVDDTVPSRILILDELAIMFAKIGIQNSSLAQALCSLWYKNRAGNAVGAGETVATVRLNLLGCLKCADEEEFTKIFAVGTTGGLYDRFVYGVAHRGWKFDRWWQPAGEYRLPVDVEMSHAAAGLLTAWAEERVETPEGSELKHPGRLAEIAERVALISSSANHERVVSVACMKAALRFAEWQHAIRKIYVPGDSESRDGDCTAAILRKLEQKTRDSEGKPVWFNWNRIYKGTSWNKTFGPVMCRNMRNGLVDNGTLLQETTEPEPGDEKKRKGAQTGSKPTGRYRLAE